MQVDLDEPCVVTLADQIEQGFGHRVVRLGRVAQTGGVQLGEFVGYPIQRLRWRSQTLAAQRRDHMGQRFWTRHRRLGHRGEHLGIDQRVHIVAGLVALDARVGLDRIDYLLDDATTRGRSQSAPQGRVVLDHDEVMSATAFPHPAFDDAHGTRRVVATGVRLHDHRRARRRVCQQAIHQRRQHLGVGSTVSRGALRTVDHKRGGIAHLAQRATGEQAERRCTGAHPH